METSVPQPGTTDQPNKSKKGLVIGIALAVLLCCCCVVTLGAAWYVTNKLSVSISDVYSSINEQLTAYPEIQIVPAMPEETAEPYSSPSKESTPQPAEQPGLDIFSDLIPKGGLGDDIQRTQAWSYSVILVLSSGCKSPVARDTIVETTQQPDASGAWRERWTIACSDAPSVPVDITFTPSSAGITDINVELAK